VVHIDGIYSRKAEGTEIVVAGNPGCRVVIFGCHSVDDVVGGEMGGYDFVVTVVSAFSVESHHWDKCPCGRGGTVLGIDDSIVSRGAGVSVGRCG